MRQVLRGPENHEHSAEERKVTAPIGAVVSLYVDLVESVWIGDIIETQTGRRYSVLAVRVQMRGKAAGRQHLRCLVVDRDTEPSARLTAGDVSTGESGEVHTIRWYKR